MRWLFNIVLECQVAAEEAEQKMTEMTKAVDELKKLLKQATHGEIYLLSALAAINGCSR